MPGTVPLQRGSIAHNILETVMHLLLITFCHIGTAPYQILGVSKKFKLIHEGGMTQVQKM